MTAYQTDERHIWVALYEKMYQQIHSNGQPVGDYSDVVTMLQLP